MLPSSLPAARARACNSNVKADNKFTRAPEHGLSQAQRFHNLSAFTLAFIGDDDDDDDDNDTSECCI